MKYIRIVLMLFVIFCSKIQAQDIKPEMSINLGLNYDLLGQEDYLIKALPSISFQYDQFELGGMYLLISNETLSNYFFKYYLLKDKALSFEFGSQSKNVSSRSVGYITKYATNPITGVFEKTNVFEGFDLFNDYTGYYLSLGYSFHIEKGFYITPQLEYLRGKSRVRFHVTENYSNSTDFEDPSHYNFYLETRETNINDFVLSIGLTYKFGLK